MKEFQFSRAQSCLGLLVLSNQQPKTKTYLNDYHTWPNKAANSHIWEVGTSPFLAVFLEKWLKHSLLIKIVANYFFFDWLNNWSLQLQTPNSIMQDVLNSCDSWLIIERLITGVGGCFTDWPAMHDHVLICIRYYSCKLTFITHWTIKCVVNIWTDALNMYSYLIVGLQNTFCMQQTMRYLCITVFKHYLYTLKMKSYSIISSLFSCRLNLPHITCWNYRDCLCLWNWMAYPKSDLMCLCCTVIFTRCLMYSTTTLKYPCKVWQRSVFYFIFLVCPQHLLEFNTCLCTNLFIVQVTDLCGKNEGAPSISLTKWFWHRYAFDEQGGGERGWHQS